MHLLRLYTIILALLRIVCEGTLLLTQALWTNGQRKKPTYVCKNDLNKELFWHHGFGALSKAGMIQQYYLGEKIYDSFTPDMKQYNSKKIYVRSSDDPAAIASAYANLIGMYYNRDYHKPDIDYPNVTDWPMGFVPIPVHSADPIIDYEVNGASECDYYHKVLSKIRSSTQYMDYISQNNDTLMQISNICGENIDPFDLWKIEEASNIENREHLKNLFPQDLQTQIHNLYVAIETIKYKTENISMAMARGGNLLWRVVQNMVAKIECQKGKWSAGDMCYWMQPLQYYSYSTDMVMMRSLLANLNGQNSLLDKTFKDNVVAIIFELLDQRNFRILIWNEESRSLEPVTDSIPGCLKSDITCNITYLLSFAEGIYNESSCSTNQSTVAGFSTSKVHSQNPASIIQQSTTMPDTNNETLEFIQAVWRHGDRSPVARFVCRTDVNKESAWPQGFDQLTHNGMREHMKFGRLIYQRYAVKLGFISTSYSDAETYVRSTDYNRTIISAISNLIGTFCHKGVQEGVDYPNTTEYRWPSGYVPIPIHTIYRSNDPYADIPYTSCQRKTWLQNLAVNSPEVVQIIQENAELFSTFNHICGNNNTLLNVNGPIDTWLVEDIYNKTQVFDVTMFNELKGLDIYAEKVKAGLLESPVINNMNLSIELPKIRGGPLLWHLITNMQQKIDCANSAAMNCSEIKNRKYYIFSSHDITLNALFITLGCYNKIIHAGIPNYSAGVIFELWKSSQGTRSIRMLYHRGEYEDTFEDITDTITGCPKNQSCPLDIFVKRSAPYLLPLSEVPQACSNTKPPETTTTTTPVSTTKNSPKTFSLLTTVFTILVGLIF